MGYLHKSSLFISGPMVEMLAFFARLQARKSLLAEPSADELIQAFSFHQFVPEPTFGDIDWRAANWGSYHDAFATAVDWANVTFTKCTVTFSSLSTNTNRYGSNPGPLTWVRNARKALPGLSFFLLCVGEAREVQMFLLNSDGSEFDASNPQPNNPTTTNSFFGPQPQPQPSMVVNSYPSAVQWRQPQPQPQLSHRSNYGTHL